MDGEQEEGRMPYMQCPECGLGVGGSRAAMAELCPRCLGRGEPVPMELALGQPKHGLFVDPEGAARISSPEPGPRFAGP